MSSRPCLCEANGLCWLCTIWATAKGLAVWRPKSLPKPVEEIMVETGGKVRADLFSEIGEDAK